MTKEEKIKEAYGEHWENIKNNLFENGWTKWTQSNRFSDLEFNSELNLMRPLSLKGIENNNCWIKIESENDLPDNIEGLWEVVRNGEQIFIELLKDNKQRLYKDFLKDGITHYKIKEKSQPPIY